MRITKWGECGILCSIYLAKRHQDGAIGASEIAASQGIDLQYAQQILHRLKKGSVVDAVRGPRGGYRLKRPPEEISLREVLYASEGSTFQIICDYAPIHPGTDVTTECSNKESCSLHEVWRELGTAIDQLLESKKLDQLAKLERLDDGLVQVGKKTLLDAQPSER